MSVPLRAALYLHLRVSTARQAEHDVSIPDQKRRGEAYCDSRGYHVVETYVEAGASATNDRRPEFQRMIEAGTSKPAPLDIVIVHSFSRFSRDHFELEFYVRKLAKNGVKLVSITQEMGDDPIHVMMRQIMALFDEYQSKENAATISARSPSASRSPIARSVSSARKAICFRRSPPRAQSRLRPALAVLFWTGGAGGIRTLDRALQPYNGLANRRLQPLGHSSVRPICPTQRPAASGRFQSAELPAI